jgi:serine/threonine protein kinase
MLLGPGARLGPYDVLSAIGAGGMGEVYRARDTKLNREVALKISMRERILGSVARTCRSGDSGVVIAKVSINIVTIARLLARSPRTRGDGVIQGGFRSGAWERRFRGNSMDSV